MTIKLDSGVGTTRMPIFFKLKLLNMKKELIEQIERRSERVPSPSSTILDDNQREYIAAAAMQGMLSNPNRSTDPEWVASRSLEYADALIKKLNQ